MAAASIAHKGSRKGPFLKAYSRFGKIGRAAAVVHISRDAVHDWRRNDPFFARAFLAAKQAFQRSDDASIQSHCDFFIAVLKPLVTDEEWPRISSALALAIANRVFRTDFNEGALPLDRFPSRKTMESNLSHQPNPGLAYPGEVGLRRPF